MAKLKFAVLIDGDNVSPKLLKSIMAEINKEGDIVLKRIYGDWTTPHLNGWKDLLQEVPIRPFQQFRYGENATDGSLIMDAIELVFSNSKAINAFAIISSDSDFYSVALRLREHGMYVLGMGKRETKDILINACNRFIYFDNLVTSDTGSAHQRKDRYETPLEEIVLNAYYASELDNDNWLSLGILGKSIRNESPGFDPRSYNYSNLLELVTTFSDYFEIKHDTLTPPNYWIRALQHKSMRAQAKKGVIKRQIGSYGFIESDDGDYFFTTTNIVPESRTQKMKKGQSVVFEVFKAPNPNSDETEEKNGRAKNIKFV